MTNYEVGGTISVTLKDGTKITNSPIAGYTGFPDSRHLARGSICLVGIRGEIGRAIQSVDSYTPPTPIWAAENVRIIQSRSLGFVKAYRETLDGFPLPDCWTISDGEDSISTLELQEKADDWEIYGVAP